MKIYILTLLTLLLISCENKPTIEFIELSYKLENNSLYHKRIDAFIFDNPKIQISCKITNTSKYDGVYTIQANIISEKAERKKIEIKRYIQSGQTIDIKHEEEIKRNTFQKIDMQNFKITSGILIDTKTGNEIN